MQWICLKMLDWLEPAAKPRYSLSEMKRSGLANTDWPFHSVTTPLATLCASAKASLILFIGEVGIPTNISQTRDLVISITLD